MPHPLDPSHMDDIITASPQQFSDGIRAAADVSLPTGTFDQVIVAGLGGSWMAAQLLSDLGVSRVPVTIHRDYGLDGVWGKAPLIIASSFSGNTEETLSAYDAAKTAGYT